MTLNSSVGQFLRLGLATIGSVMAALSVVIFMTPFDIAPSGVVGVAVILNEVLGLPIGVMTFLFNIPILYAAYRMLPNRKETVLGTLWIVVVYTVVLDNFAVFWGEVMISDDRLLNAIFGGIVVGLGSGIVYRSGMSMGGTSTIALIVQRKTGMSMSSVYLYTDTLIIVAAGFVFGIEGALYALVVLFITGVATDYVMEGPSVIRTATIITNQPEPVSKAIIGQLGRGVTLMNAKGMYTGQERAMLYVTISRSQVNELIHVVTEADNHAFVVIGMGHSAFGEGFRLPKRSKRATPSIQSTEHDSEISV